MSKIGLCRMVFEVSGVSSAFSSVCCVVLSMYAFSSFLFLHILRWICMFTYLLLSCL